MEPRVTFSLSSLLAGALLVACHPAAISGDVIKVVGVTVRTEEDGKRTKVHFEGPGGKGEISLALEPPCAVVRNHRGEPLTHSYKSAGNATVVIFVGKLAEEFLPDGKTRQVRGSQSQAVLIRNGRVSASKRVVTDGRWSPSQGMDEKEFWLFAHEQRRP